MEVKRKINPESIDKQSDDSCWERYKKVGMKIKNQKKVPTVFQIRKDLKNKN